MLFFADRLPPLVGGMEMHARYFVGHFERHRRFPLAGVVTRDSDDVDCLVVGTGREPVDHCELAARFDPAVVFFNSGRWIEDLERLRALFPRAVFVYRTGGNEILKAPLERHDIADHVERLGYWTRTLNDAIDLLITNSAFTEERLRNVGVQCAFARCVGGVNFAALAGSPNPRRSGPPVMVCAARFVPYKHHGLLLEVASALVARGHVFELRLAGDGPLLQEARQRVIQQGLESCVTFLGALDNEAVCAEIARADLYVQLSGDVPTPVPGGSYVHAEGMGRSILEALSAGTYVVAGRCGALPEVVTVDRGLLVDLDNREGIVDAVARLLTTPSPRPPPTDAYDWSHVFERYERHWEALLAGPHRH